MKKVYVVTHGHHSEREIVAVYDNEPEAIRHKDGIGEGGYEEYELNKVYPVPPGLDVFYVGYNHHRDSWSAAKCGDRLFDVGRSDILRNNVGSFNSPVYDYYFRTYCLARDEEHALKIASERKAFMIATYGEDVGSEHDFGGRVPEVENA